MDSVSVSAKGQLVLPKNVRRQVGLENGGLVNVILQDGRIVLEPVMPGAKGWRRWRGVLAGTSALEDHVAEHRAEVVRDAKGS